MTSSFNYIETTIPAGMTIAEYRRTRSGAEGRGTRILVRRLRPALIGSLLVAVVWLACAAEALAAAGGFDPRFGRGGTATLTAAGTAYAAALQRDGKIVVAGDTTVATGDTDVLVYRLNPDGSPDRSFDGDGKVRINRPGIQEATALTLQPDGKIIVGGYTYPGPPKTEDAIVYRLTPAGSPDLSFDTDGAATIDYGGNESAEGLALRPDGKILVAGYTSAGVGGQGDATVYRLLANGGGGLVNGALDPSFDDNDGATRIDSGGAESANAIALQPDGRIVVAGRTTKAGVSDAVVYRLKPDGDPLGNVNGALDPSFDGDGAVGIDRGGDEQARALALQPDGKIVVAGYRRPTTGGGTRDAAVYRLTAAGAPDPSFDRDGTALIDSGGNEDAEGLALQPDGKVVLAGVRQATTGSASDAAVYRLTTGGGLDRSFDRDGQVFIPTGRPYATSVLIQPDRKLVVAGFTSPGGDVRDMTVHRLFGDPYDLRVESSGPGSVTSIPAGIACAPTCSRGFDIGTPLTLTATPAPDARFEGWAGGGCSGSGSCRLTLAGNTAVAASFAPAAFGRETGVTLRLATRRIRARGPVRVVVANANDFSVRGRLAALASRSRRKPLKLRARTLTLAANGGQTLRLTLPRALRRQLERKRKLRLRLTATVTDPAGNTRTVKRRLSPRLKRGK